MLNRVRALENQCFLVAANSVGPNPAGAFIGHSMMVNPWGVILTSGGDEEVMLRVELDSRNVDKCREIFPAYSDRRESLKSRGSA